MEHAQITLLLPENSISFIFFALLICSGLRRTCARLCHLAGGELEQIPFLLGHVSIQTTERYRGSKQKLRFAVNDKLGLEP